MKTFSFFLIIFLLILANIHCETPEAKLTKQLDAIAKKHELMGLVLNTLDSTGAVTYSYKTGYQKNQKTLASENTYFRVASISKSITAMALMTLYDQGKFKLDDDISTHLGYEVRNPHFKNTPITIRQILSHTSSIRDGEGYSKFLAASAVEDPTKIPSLKELLQPTGLLYVDSVFSTDPVGYFEYTNLNFGIAGALVEIFSKKRFDIYVREKMFLPLGIKGSFNQADIDDWENIATIYSGNNGVWQANFGDYNEKPKQRNLVGYAIGTNGVLYGPAGSCVIRVKDLNGVLQILSGQKPNILSKAASDLINTPHWVYNGNNGNYQNGKIRNYGLGTILSTNTEKQDVIWPGAYMKGHAGRSHGLISNLYFNPKDNFGYVFATNGALHDFANSDTSGYSKFEEETMLATYNYVYTKSCDQNLYLLNQRCYSCVDVAKECTKCNDNSKCASCFKDSTYPNCQNCYKQCSICFNQDSCKSCVKDYQWEDKKCQNFSGKIQYTLFVLLILFSFLY